jgi:hypothetical protein
MFRIRQYSSADAHSWNEFIARSKNGTFLFDRRYMDYHADRFSDSSLIVSESDDRWVSVLPANRVDSALVSHGGLTYGGLISDEEMTTSRMIDLFAALLRYLAEAGIERLEYKTVPAIYHSLPAEEDRFALFLHGASLSRRDVLSVVDLGAQGRIQERRRRGAKKAESLRVAVEESDDWAPFWDVLTANLLDRHGRRPVHSLDEIVALARKFPDNIRLFVAKREGVVLGGVVMYLASPTAHAQYIGSSAEGRQCGALDLLFGSLIDRHRSFRYFDFGISNEGATLNRGLSDFKDGFGARAVVHDHYVLQVSSAGPAAARPVS